MPDWLQRHIPDGWTTPHLFAATLGLFVFSFVVSILAVGYAILKIPHDYFSGDKARRAWQGRHLLIRVPLLVFKNIAGLLLIGLGIVLSLPGVPGQGLLTVLLGAMLVDFPGKRRFECWLVGRRGVLSTINKVRLRYGKPPLDPPVEPADCKPDV